MRIAGIEKYSVCNGEGVRQVVYFQGCNHKCVGCHNPSTWDSSGGKEMTPSELIMEIMDNWDTVHQGITLSGGDPLMQADELVVFIKLFKRWKPNRDVWLYTGYLWEEVKDLEIMKYVDVLVDGKFVKELKDLNLKFRGSSNQRIIDVKTGKGIFK